MGVRNGEILLVQDGVADFRLIARVFDDFGVRQQVRVVHSANEASRWLDFYRQQAQASKLRLVVIGAAYDSPLGRPTLERIKQDENLKHVPVVLFLAENERALIAEAYSSYANCVIAKPNDLEGFLRKIEDTLRVWLLLAELPGQSDED